ncbi:hypothetical protein BHYA_0093g00060 [Botrytis hyacinthi]|uniref:Uncharacterized protein n=1 Tax=Botrytis hyacinthi TaxID=278943 RepID=A0A4Z1GS63_9HELO|nr:hypothetical protein BHYA_0093g00060 [Botrytis hyacinthi]
MSSYIKLFLNLTDYLHRPVCLVLVVLGRRMGVSVPCAKPRVTLSSSSPSPKIDRAPSTLEPTLESDQTPVTKIQDSLTMPDHAGPCHEKVLGGVCRHNGTRSSRLQDFPYNK